MEGNTVIGIFGMRQITSKNDRRHRSIVAPFHHRASQMSFEDATSWPPELLSMLAAEREGSHHESRYYAPYDKLLH